MREAAVHYFDEKQDNDGKGLEKVNGWEKERDVQSKSRSGCERKSTALAEAKETTFGTEGMSLQGGGRPIVGR